MSFHSLTELRSSSSRSGMLLIALVCFIWALMETVTQYAAREYSLYQVVWVRYAVHLLFMLIVFGPRLGRKLISTQRMGLQLIRSVMMLIMPVSFIVGVQYMPAGSMLALFWLAPFMIMALSWLWLRERVSWHYWLLAGLGLLCILVLTRPSGSTLNWMGILFALAMGLSFSLYLVMTRVLREEPTLTSLFYTALGVLVPLSFKLPAVWKPLTLQGGLLMAAVGLLGFALLWFLDKAMELTSAAVTAPLLFSEMFWIIVLRLILRIF